jgi:hypothetical protein
VKEVKKAIRKKRRSHKKQAQKQQQQQQHRKGCQPLDYYTATTTTQKATAELMSKVGWWCHTPVAWVCSRTQVALHTDATLAGDCNCSCWASLCLKKNQTATWTLIWTSRHFVLYKPLHSRPRGSKHSNAVVLQPALSSTAAAAAARAACGDMLASRQLLRIRTAATAAAAAAATAAPRTADPHPISCCQTQQLPLQCCATHEPPLAQACIPTSSIPAAQNISRS